MAHFVYPYPQSHIPKGKPENHGFLKSDGFLMVKCVIVFSGGGFPEHDLDLNQVLFLEVYIVDEILVKL